MYHFGWLIFGISIIIISTQVVELGRDAVKQKAARPAIYHGKFESRGQLIGIDAVIYGLCLLIAGILSISFTLSGMIMLFRPEIDRAEPMFYIGFFFCCCSVVNVFSTFIYTNFKPSE